METYILKVIYDDNRKPEITACATREKAMELAQKKIEKMKPNENFPEFCPCTMKAINAYQTILKEEYDVYIRPYGKRILIEKILQDGSFGGKTGFIYIMQHQEGKYGTKYFHMFPSLEIAIQHAKTMIDKLLPKDYGPFETNKIIEMAFISGAAKEAYKTLLQEENEIYITSMGIHIKVFQIPYYA